MFGCLISGAGGGTRPSKRGEHTKAFSEGGGFADVRLSSNGALEVSICNAFGQTVESMSL